MNAVTEAEIDALMDVYRANYDFADRRYRRPSAIRRARRSP